MTERINQAVENHSSDDRKNSNTDGDYLDSLELRPTVTSSTTVIKSGQGLEHAEAETDSIDSYQTVNQKQKQGSLGKVLGSHDKSLRFTTSSTSTNNSTNTDLDALDVESTDSDTAKSFRPFQDYDGVAFTGASDEMRKRSYDSSRSNIWKSTSPISSLEFHPAISLRNRNRIHSKQDSGRETSSTPELVEGDSLITSSSTNTGSSSETFYGIGDSASNSKSPLLKNMKQKLGDSIPSVSQRVDNQDKLYNSLNILDEVKQLKNMSFFDTKYNEKLSQLKKSQLDLVVDMTQMNENSFTEFYNIWDALNGAEDQSESSEQKKTDKAKNTKHEESIRSLEMLDINNSKTFEQFGEKSKVITDDIAKIEESIAEIDEYTEKLWKKV